MRPLKYLLALAMATAIFISCPTVSSILAQDSNTAASEGPGQKTPSLE